jgi:hypothetical protein
MVNLKKKIQFLYFLPESNNDFFFVEEMVEKPRNISIARSNEILGWESVGNRQLLCLKKRRLIGAC